MFTASFTRIKYPLQLVLGRHKTCHMIQFGLQLKIEEFENGVDWF